MNVATQLRAAVSDASETLSGFGKKVPKFAPLVNVSMKMGSAMINAVGQMYWDLSEHPQTVIDGLAKLIDVPLAVLEDLKPVLWENTEVAVDALVAFVTDSDTSVFTGIFEKYEKTIEEINKVYEKPMLEALGAAGLGEEDEEEVEDEEE